MKTKILSLFVAFAMSLSLLAGCDSNQETPPIVDNPTTIATTAATTPAPVVTDAATVATTAATQDPGTVAGTDAPVDPGTAAPTSATQAGATNAPGTTARPGTGTAATTVTNPPATTATAAPTTAATTVTTRRGAPPPPPAYVPPPGLNTLRGTVSISGSTSLYPVMATLTEAFKKVAPNVTVNFSDVTGSGAGRTRANNNQVSFGMVSAEWSSSNAAQFPNFIPIQICIDGVAVIVNPSNTLTNITRADLLKVYGIQDRVLNWSGVGGSDLAINVVNREDGSGTRDCFQSVLGLSGNYDRLPNASILTTTGAVITAVGSNNNSVGYASLANVENDRSVKILQYNGVTPSKATLQNGTYTLQRPFLLGVNKNRTLNDAEKEFLKYILSAEGQKIIEGQGLVGMDATAITKELAKVGIS